MTVLGQYLSGISVMILNFAYGSYFDLSTYDLDFDISNTVLNGNLGPLTWNSCPEIFTSNKNKKSRGLIG